MISFKRKPEGMDGASFNKFHKQFLEYICKTEIKRLIENFDPEAPNIKPVCVFKEPLFTTDGAYLQGEMYKGEKRVSPDIVVVYSYKNWYMLFVELKSRPVEGKLSYIIGETETEFRLLHNYMLNYPEYVYMLFENHVIPGEKYKVPRDVIESCNIDFLGVHRRKNGSIGKTLSCELPPLPELLKSPDKYPLVFRHV